MAGVWARVLAGGGGGRGGGGGGGRGGGQEGGHPGGQEHSLALEMELFSHSSAEVVMFLCGEKEGSIASDQ